MVLARAANGRGWRICEMCPVVALYFRCAEGNIKDLNATAITIDLSCHSVIASQLTT